MLRLLVLLLLIVAKIFALRALLRHLSRNRTPKSESELAAEMALSDAQHAVDGLRRTSRDFPGHTRRLAIVELEAQLRAAQQALEADDFSEARSAAQKVVEGASEIHRQIILSH